jgi:site-specific recombinase XerD
MRTPSAKAKPPQSLQSVINATKKLWRQYHLSYDQTRYVSKEVRRALVIERTKIRKRVIAQLAREEEERLIKHAYRMKGERGLLIKTLFQTGARVSEFVNIKAEDVFFEEQMILIAKAKGGKSRYVPIPTVCPSVASRNLLLYQSLPSSIPYRHANVRRRKDDPGVDTAARSVTA